MYILTAKYCNLKSKSSVENMLAKTTEFVGYIQDSIVKSPEPKEKEGLSGNSMTSLVPSKFQKPLLS